MNPRIEALEDALDNILAGIQELLQAGQSISPELQRMAAEEINALTQEIDRLYNEDLNQAPSDNVRLVWILAGGQEDAFTSYLSNFPDPEFQRLLSNPSQLERTIQELHASNLIPEEPQVADGFEKTQLNSSNVFGVKYDFKKNRLLIRFNNGSVYEYNTPPQMYNLIAGGRASATTDDKRNPMRFWRGKNPSIGAAVWQYLRNGNVPYRRLK